MKRININNFFNHKMLFPSGIDIKIYEDENWGICGNFFNEDLFCALIEAKRSSYKKLKYDNIICFEQKIPIKQKIERIEFVGFAEWGSYNEKIILECLTGRIERDLFFYEWHTFPNKQFEKDFYHGACELKFRISTSLGEKVCMYSFSINLPKKEFVNSIVLPQNPAIHIFKINVE